MNKRLKIKEIIYNHITRNSKEYAIIFMIFVIGIFFGVLFLNNMADGKFEEVRTYLNSFIEKVKNTQNINNFSILKTSIIENITLALIIWFFGTTVIGIPIVFGIVLYRGFCLGYTISAIAMTMGTWKGLSFVFITVVLQNIIFIPALIAICVSGFKLYKSIVKDKNKENIKIEIFRHTVFSLIMLAVMCISSLIESIISMNLLKLLIKYF